VPLPAPALPEVAFLAARSWQVERHQLSVRREIARTARRGAYAVHYFFEVRWPGKPEPKSCLQTFRIRLLARAREISDNGQALSSPISERRSLLCAWPSWILNVPPQQSDSSCWSFFKQPTSFLMVGTKPTNSRQHLRRPSTRYTSSTRTGIVLIQREQGWPRRLCRKLRRREDDSARGDRAVARYFPLSLGILDLWSLSHHWHCRLHRSSIARGLLAQGDEVRALIICLPEARETLRKF